MLFRSSLAAAVGVGEVNLSWTASFSANSYNLKRGTSPGTETLLAAGITGTSYADSSAAAGQRYFYVVSAVNAVGQGPNSNEALARPAKTGDYDGDGKTDLAVYRPSTGQWFNLQSTSDYTRYVVVPWGASTDVPIPGR